MNRTPPGRVVIRAPNWLGDVILSLPAVRDIRHAYKEARLSVVARPSVAALYEAVPEIDEVLEASGLSQEIAAMRRGFDLAILLTNSVGTALAATLGGVPQRWGYATEGRGLLLTRRAPVSPDLRGRSQVHYYRAMLAAMGLPEGDGLDTSLAPPSTWRDTGRGLVGPGLCFGLAPGAAKGSAKQWPPERFAAAGDALAQELGARAVLLGSPADSECRARGGSGHESAFDRSVRPNRPSRVRRRRVVPDRSSGQRFRRHASGRRPRRSHCRHLWPHQSRRNPGGGEESRFRARRR